MIEIQQLLVTIANTPAHTPVVVDVAGNGKALMPVTAAEVRDGKLVIDCEVPPGSPKTGTSKSEKQSATQIDALAKTLLSEFGGPAKDESACEMAIRVLHEQQSQIEALTAPSTKAPPADTGETMAFSGDKS